MNPETVSALIPLALPLHPEPVRRGLAPRAVPDPCLRPGDHPRRHRRGLGGREALGGARRHARPDRRHRPVGGARRPDRRAALPRGHRHRPLLRAGPATRGRARRSGTAASASGARSPVGSSARGSTPAATASGCARWPTRSRRDCCSRRRSAGSATTSTRSSTARPTDLPWGLEIDAAHWPAGTDVPGRDRRSTRPSSTRRCGTSPASPCCSTSTDALRLGYGRVFALYVMIYTAGRGWIEALRIDTIELDDVLGLRWGVWMSIILFVGAAAYFVVVGRRHRPPEHPRALAVRRTATKRRRRLAGRRPQRSPDGSADDSRTTLGSASRALSACHRRTPA